MFSDDVSVIFFSETDCKALDREMQFFNNVLTIKCFKSRQLARPSYLGKNMKKVLQFREVALLASMAKNNVFSKKFKCSPTGLGKKTREIKFF